MNVVRVCLLQKCGVCGVGAEIWEVIDDFELGGGVF